MLKRKLLAFAASVAMSLIAPNAEAQIQRANPITNPDGSVTVAVPPFNTPGSVIARPRPDYDAPGLRMGEFVMLPSVSAGTIYNSNVFNTPTDTKSDWAFELTPMLRLISDLPRHALNVLIGAHSLFYTRLDSENTTDITINGQGRLDIRRSTNVTVDAGYVVLHEARGAVDLPGNAAEPTEYAVANAQAMLNHTFNRLRVSAGASIQDLDYSNTKLVPPGPAVLNNHDRDRDMLTGLAEAAYEFSPGTSAFLRGSYNERNYAQTLDAAGFRRDSEGSEVDGGVQFELSQLVVGQLYAGYLQQSYDDARFSDVGGAAFGAQLEWYPTLLTTVRLNARRAVEETTIAGASSYLTSHVALGVDHELLRNLVISLDALYDHNDYNDSPRTDTFWGFAVGAMYLVNRNLQANIGYVFSRRESNIAGFDYSNNIFRVGLTGKL